MAQLKEICRWMDERLQTGRFGKDVSNNGLQVQGNPEVRRIIAGVDGCQALFRAAADRDADLVIVHHGISWGSEPRRFAGSVGRQMAMLFGNGISLYAAHLPLDSHQPADANSTKGGWYACKGIYNADAFEGLSLKYFIDAVTAEGGQYFAAGCNAALHTHGLFHTMDVYGDGKPSNIANNPDAGAINKEGDFPVSENICNSAFSIPWFKHFDRALIDEQIAAVRKVCENYKDLLASDPKEKVVGKFFQTARKN